MKLSVAVGKRIENLLTEKGLKPYYLFKEGGIPRSTVSVIIHGKYDTVNLDTVYQIAATLNITLKEFFADKLFEDALD